MPSCLEFTFFKKNINLKFTIASITTYVVANFFLTYQTEIFMVQP